MPASVSLRKVLRQIPDFAALPGDTLDGISHRLLRREYQPGELIWRIDRAIDFLGIIQKGEIVLEYRKNGRLVHSSLLQAGAVVRPFAMPPAASGATLSARAMTEVRIYYLHKEDLPSPEARQAYSEPVKALSSRARGNVFGESVTTVVIVLAIILLSWPDLTRLVSQSIYFFSAGAGDSPPNYSGLRQSLAYAKAIEPNAPFINNAEGKIWFTQNNFTQAEQAFSRALEVHPNDKAALNNLATTHFQMDRRPEALQEQRKAVQADPNSALLRYNLGVILMSQNLTSEALQEFKQANIIQPRWAPPYTQRAYLYLQLKDYPAAEREAQIASQFDPTQPSPKLILAIALYNQGKYAIALNTINQAVQIQPDDLVSVFYKALILAKLDQADQARLILQQLLHATTEPQQFQRIQAELKNLNTTTLRALPENAP